MVKSIKTNSTNRTQNQNWGLFLIGLGLLLLGVVTGILLIGADKVTTSTNTSGSEVPPSNSTIPVEVNFKAPDLKLQDLDGNEVSISDYLGKVILINNWATWCPPCKAEMPSLEAYYQAHKVDGFILIAIDAGDPATEVEDFVQDYGLTFPIWLDPDGLALKAFMNNGLPSSYVVNREGIIQLTWTGAISDSMLEKYVTPLLQE